MLEISPYPTLLQLKYFIDRIHHCVTVAGKWIFDRNYPFEPPLTKDNLDYCCIEDDKTKVTDGYKGIRVLSKDNNKIVLQK